MIKGEEKTMTQYTAEMNDAIGMFCERMKKEDVNSANKKKSFEECTVDEYFDYLETLCNFCDEDEK